MNACFGVKSSGYFWDSRMKQIRESVSSCSNGLSP